MQVMFSLQKDLPVSLPPLAHQPAALAIGILWAIQAESFKPSTMAPILTAVPWQYVPEKYPGVTTHLLTAKSKSPCSYAPFPVKETLHHRSSFVPAWSF